MLKSVSTASLLLALTLGFAPANPAAAQTSLITPAIRSDFTRAEQGDKSATERSAATLRRLSDANPTDPVVRAYLGSALAMQGRDAWMPWNKMKAVEAGTAELDKALAQLTPGHETAAPGQLSAGLETRMNAIGTFIELPDLFHRFEAARAVIKQALAQPALATAPREPKARIYAWAAEAASRAGDKVEAERLAKLAKENGWTEARK